MFRRLFVIICLHKHPIILVYSSPWWIPITQIFMVLILSQSSYELWAFIFFSSNCIFLSRLWAH
jgi:hypothetical protein